MRNRYFALLGTGQLTKQIIPGRALGLRLLEASSATKTTKHTSQACKVSQSGSAPRSLPESLKVFFKYRKVFVKSCLKAILSL